jgi:hypothetical protein
MIVLVYLINYRIWADAYGIAVEGPEKCETFADINYNVYLKSI